MTPIQNLQQALKILKKGHKKCKESLGYVVCDHPQLFQLLKEEIFLMKWEEKNK